MQLPEIDRFDPQPPAAGVRLLDQVFRPSQRNPDIRPGARQAALSGDMDRPIRVQRLVNERLGKIRTVGIGGVDEVDAKRRQPTERAQRLGAILRRTPDPAPDDPHGAEPEPVDVEGAADTEAPGLCSVDHRHCLIGWMRSRPARLGRH